ncbi:DNA-binding helix-turn-helix protein [uncultured Eubacteriales bacterium]|uniref:DNA-binding helix-turn-helix protein n=1 Tax=uncultured Eubacteriales bacterium TaxID=172733 RepID=A0A212KIQ6_9FIRM|nr:DNA-binding helix-turn-helix protein [uncultured Eubacteriales bacterium]
MITLAQRIETLRTESNLSRPALAAALGFPKGSFDKFETGRATPTKEQQEKMAAYFGVSLFYLRGESNDRTRQETWMDAAVADDEPDPAPARKSRPAKVYDAPKDDQPTVWDTLLAGKQTQDLLRSIVLETLKSPEGQELIAKAVIKELARRQN